MPKYRNINDVRSVFSELHGPDGSVLVLEPGEEVELPGHPNSVWLVPVESAPASGWKAEPVTAEPAKDTPTE